MADNLILFWSGGKDAFLALKQIDANSRVTLLTTFAESTAMVPHQEIPVDLIEEQANHLGLELLTVPLPDPCPNELYLGKLEEILSPVTPKPALVFGDLLLADIRAWREKVFTGMGYECRFPIWGKPYGELLEKLWQQPVDVILSAVAEPCRDILQPGMKYDEKLIRNLPDHIDPMGENGEFHTRVKFTLSGEIEGHPIPLYPSSP